MSWTYADWDEQPTTAGKLTRARQFRTEIQSRITRDVGADGKTVSSGPLVEMLKTLREDIKDLERRPDAQGGGTLTVADFSDD